MKAAVFERALEHFQIELSDFDPALITTGDAARLFEVFSAIEKTMGAAMTLVAGRAVVSENWKKEGHRSPVAWMAATTGTAEGDVQGMVENSGRLVSLPQTTEALRKGEFSGAQIREIVATAAVNPSAERELLDAARGSSLKGLKDECRRVKARATSESEARTRYEEIRKTRFLRMWTEADGAGRVEARLAPDDFARFAGAIRKESNAVFNEARKSGRRESIAAYQADALVSLATGTSASGPSRSGPSGAGTGGCAGSSGARPPTMMHLRVDMAALRRGRLQNGETCEIPGVGPVPLATAVNEVGNAVLRVIITDGVDVRTVCHVGRAIPAHLRTALEDRDEKCVVPGCDVERGLEIDHYQIGFAQDGPTELWNLCRLCKWHHYLKTYSGYALTGEPGSWEWTAPVSEENPVLTS
jgi:hypothetical protein